MADEMSIPLGSFPETQWTLVFRAGRSGEERREALGELLERYLPALKAHLVLKKGIDRDRANDLVQGFVADKIVEQDLLSHVTGGKGKFRTFLLTVLDRYVVDQIRRETAGKRCPKGTEPIEAADDAARLAPDPFDVAWARGVLAEALRQMQAHCRSSERQDVWGIFQCRILAPTLEGIEPLPYGQVVRRFGLRSPSQASNVVITAKRMFARILRAVVGDYVKDAAEIETEIGELKEILAKART